jgi:hypothetical protein
LSKPLTRASRKYIAEPDEAIAFQSRITSAPGFKQTQLRVFPEVESSDEALNAILATGGLKGIDLEFRPDLTPTICAVTTLDRIYCVPWSNHYASRLREAFKDTQGPDGQPYEWVAHSTVGADKSVIDKALGIKTPISIWSDSMETHWLRNAHLCKAPDKDESDDAGSLGFNDLWTTASLTTDLSRWKACRGAICEGPDVLRPGYSRLSPCPTHSAMSYCGIDAWVSPVSHIQNWEFLAKRGITRQYYRDRMELSEIYYDMQHAGVKVDLAHVIRANAILDERKDKLFAYEGVGKARVYADFNPKSDRQIKAWFEENAKIRLKKTDKETIRQALLIALADEGIEGGLEGLHDFDGTLTVPVQKLHDLYTFKSEGKGLDPWFAEKFFSNSLHPEYAAALASLGVASINDVTGPAFEAALMQLAPHAYMYPRWVGTGTSMGRLSSSSPNNQNHAKRGLFGQLTRTAIVPRDGSLELSSNDCAQLELRGCLYLAGEPYMGADAFRWLVTESGDKFHEAAKLARPEKYAKDPAEAARDIAKVVSHSADYLQGLVLLEPWKLNDPATLKLIASGALRVYTKKYQPRLAEDWTFFGKVVAFTGGGLAEMLFKDKSVSSRAKALAIQEDIYFKRFFVIREWQKRVLDFVQDNGYVQSPVGRFLQLYGTPDEIAKVAIAFLGQGMGADHVQGLTLKFRRELGMTPLLQVHDDLTFEVPKSLTNKQLCDTVKIMETETDRFPGFTCPIEAKRGPNWWELKSIYKNGVLAE